ncbi:MAG: type II toxin-antitoxin system VapC family toxin [Terriglobales bacterium]
MVLDSGELGMIVRPQKNSDVTIWLHDQAARGAYCCLPEIVDFELRRELLFQDFADSLQRLDQLHDALLYLPVDTATLRTAAQLWAESMRAARPVAHPKELNVDVILAAQARRVHLQLRVPADSVAAVVATDNVGHLGRFVTAKRWDEIQ